MVERLYEELSRRLDLEIIASMIPENTSVLDLGCGDGSFLRALRDAKNIRCLGVEIDPDMIARCIGNGIPVIQGDLNDPLRFAEDGSFDWVILSRTLQQLVRPDRLMAEMLRVGHRAALSFINFGYFQCRLQLLFAGRMPRNRQIPYQWYNTPNIHLGTIDDFRDLCAKLDVEIVRQTAIGRNRMIPDGFWTNLFAPGCVFELRKRQDP